MHISHILAYWRKKSWRERTVLILTTLVSLVLISHPELRIFLPLLDALGLELLVAVLGAQCTAALTPMLRLYAYPLTEL
jgi:hypothetical protein